MCVVSMVSDHYRDKWKDFGKQEGVTIPLSDWFEYQELKRKAKEYDERNNQPHCEKPDIADWEQKILDVLKEQGLIK